MLDYYPEDPRQILRCLVTTILTSVVAGFILIFGSLQLYVYRNSTHRRYVNQMETLKLFYLQICLSLIVPALALVQMIVQTSDGGKLNGFMITTVVLTCCAYPYSICLILTERYYRLRSVAIRGHGLVLLIFWLLSHIAENISIIYLQFNDEIEIIFFALRYGSVLLLFILGLIAPGIVKDDDDHDAESNIGELDPDVVSLENREIRTTDNESNIGVLGPDVVSHVRPKFPENWEIRTTFIVPHRLSTLINRDEIIVLKEGVIVERGRHDDLMMLNGTYANVWSTQLQNLYSEQTKDDPITIRNEESKEKFSAAVESQLLVKCSPIPPALPPPPIPPPLPHPPQLYHLPLPPPPLPLSSFAPPLLSLPPPMLSPQPIIRKNVPEPGNALKRFHWSKLADVKIKGTIWSELTNSELYANVDLLKSIDITFSAYQSKNSIDVPTERLTVLLGQTEPLENNRLKNISVIDRCRAQNLTILLNRLRLSDKEIFQTILSMDLNDQLATDIVERLLKFVPSREEKLLLEQHSKNTDSLDRADGFLYEISKIPDYEQRLKSLLYKKQFTPTVDDLLSRISTVTEACREVNGSKRLKKLLGIILDLGNYLNYGTRFNASGFHLASLNRLIETKSSAVKGMTLLHYLVQIIEKEFDDLLNIAEDFQQVRFAYKVSLVEVDKDMSMLRNSLAEVFDFAKEFFEQATVKFEELENQLKEMKTRFGQVVRRFGEDGSIMQSDEFFGIFNDFLIAFDGARQGNNNLKKLQEDGEKRVKQEAEIKRCRRSMGENSYSKADSKGAASVLQTDEELTKISKKSTT